MINVAKNESEQGAAQDTLSHGKGKKSEQFNWSISKSSPNFRLLAFLVLICFELNAFRLGTNPSFHESKKKELVSKYVRGKAINGDLVVPAINIPSTMLSEKIGLPPLIFGVGQGTTGTHSMFLATCHMNATSVHGIETCLYGEKHSDVEPRMIDGMKAHALATKYYKKIRSCAHQQSNCSFQDVKKYVEKLRGLIREVILSPIGAVHDTPYTFMTKYVIEVATEVRGVPPILMHSVRDPDRWAERRAEAHPNAIVCKFFFEYDHEQFNKEGAFDLNHCMDIALQKEQESGLPLTQFEDVYASYRQLIDRAGQNATKLQELTHFNKVAIENYQTSMLALNPIYVIDMFEREEFSDVPTIAKEFNEALLSNTETELQTRMKAAGFSLLLNSTVPHRKGRYSRLHPFIKGLIKKEGTKVIAG